MDISLVIVNFNTPELTINCLNSILKFTLGVTYEVIIVDNAPKKDFSSDFKSIFPELKYHKFDQNVGFGIANNEGIKLCNGDYILLLNSDTLLIDNSLKYCFDYMQSYAEIGLLGCKLLNGDLSYQGSFFPFVNNSISNYLKGNNYLLFKLLNISKKFEEPNEIKLVGDISGAFMFFRKEIIDKTKPFDPDFFLYCEESEWCRERISKITKIAYYPFTKVIHLGGQSAPKDYMFIQSKLSLFLMWYKKGWSKYLAFIIMAYLNMFLNMFLYFFVNKNVKNDIKLNFKAHFDVIPYLFNSIPLYPTKWGGRKEPLIYEKARFIFFPNKDK